MCLFIKELKPLIAKEDINCYKIVIPNKNSILTAYQLSEIKLHSTQLPNHKPSYSNINGFFKIAQGYVFAYKRINTCMQLLLLYDRPYKIVKCVIPSGTKYFQDANQFASEKLEILDLL